MISTRARSGSHRARTTSPGAPRVVGTSARLRTCSRRAAILEHRLLFALVRRPVSFRDAGGELHATHQRAD